MASPSNNNISSPFAAARPDPGRDIFHSLVAVASCAGNAQLDGFTLRLANALFSLSEASRDPSEANLSFNAANTLRNNGYAFYYLASVRLEEALRQAAERTVCSTPAIETHADDDFTLVSYDEMDRHVAFGRVSRPLENKHAEQFETLGRQLAHLLGREELPLAQNPFRPEVFLRALHDAWCEFAPEADAHPLVLPLLQPEVFIDMSGVLQELIDALAARGFSPDVRYRFSKSDSAPAPQGKKSISEAVSEQLKHLLNRTPQAAPAAPFPEPSRLGQPAPVASIASDHAGTDLHGQVLQMAAVNNQLLTHLAGMQKTLFDQLATGGMPTEAHSMPVLPAIKQQAPHGMLSAVDETKIDLLTKVFDVVFRDQNIPSGIKPLIGLLQVPILKAALLDEEFFFQDQHPARKLIDLLSRSSLGWEQQNGSDDPLYQTIQRNVTRVQQEFHQDLSVFSDVVSDLENFLQEEETAETEALAPKIGTALKQEKIGQATKVARHEVALRIGTGEVVAFVEGFLEKKWVPVLTLAYSIKDEKPDAVENAIKTMDDLVWSVKPKITAAERKELIAKLPPMLASLNQWLNLLKWDDAERLQFFAELAECHASIVRAPLELSPQRQLEIAMDVARQAAERRLQKRLNQTPQPVADAVDQQVQKLARGAWMEFIQPDGTPNLFRLAWVSPLHTLYIFSTRDRKEAFSLSAENLALAMRRQQATVVSIDQLVGHALAEAVGDAGANDAEMEPRSVA
jgi:hypothetical protein